MFVRSHQKVPISIWLSKALRKRTPDSLPPTPLVTRSIHIKNLIFS